MVSLYTVRTENPHTPKAHPSATNFHKYHSDIPQTLPRHPPDVSRERDMPTDAKGQLPDSTDSTCLCLGVSVCVCWCLLVCCVPWRCHGVVWGVSEGYLSGIHRNWRRSDVLGGYVGSQSLQYRAKPLFRHSPERHNFCHLTILRH